MSFSMPAPSAAGSLAPLFSIPDIPIVSVEHPCIIQNVDKAIQMLGGAGEISESLRPNNEKPLGLRFQPADPTSRQVVSFNKKTNNLLLKVTVPKRTGRRRKRGSNDEFSEGAAELRAKKDVSYLLRSLEDSQQRSKVEVVGPIRSAHVWRTMPDFVYSSAGSVILNEVETKILTQEYPSLKKWSLPRAASLSVTDTEAVPPPAFSLHTLPQLSIYRQNFSAKSGSARQFSRDTETATAVLPSDLENEAEKSPKDSLPDIGGHAPSSEA